MNSSCGQIGFLARSKSGVYWPDWLVPFSDSVSICTDSAEFWWEIAEIELAG